MTDIMTPALGESVSEATVSRWAKKAGEAVKKDDVLVELETDKVALEVVAPEDGILSEIAAAEGATVVPGTVLGRVTAAGAAAGAPAKTAEPAPMPAPEPVKPAAPAATPAPAAPAPAPVAAAPVAAAPVAAAPAPAAALPLAPSVQRIVSENKLDPAAIAGSGKDGRITKGDALAALEASAAAAQAAPAVQVAAAPRALADREERVHMTRLRQTIARRLKEAQNTAAMLTTFNEVDMSAVMAMRTQYKDAFEKRHGVKLGFMSVFVKACIAALKDVPEVNAEIEGADLIYKNHYDIGVAVGTERGLVVPVVRDADALNLAGVEKAIAALGKKARDGQLALEDLQGGTFTISNGGVYGSLMSTPILNAPQSGILGMHKIQDRPMAIGGQVVIRPMMYLALSYDHRVVDGQGAVTFLVKVKEHIEDPQRLLLDL
jgi:2-oxoglutarate dehydrogenase E2 component (dihydrolipoamide succinyltransferase)